MPSRRSSAPISPGWVQRSASPRMRRFSAPENRRRLAVADTSGSGGAALEDASALAPRAPAGASSSEEPVWPFIIEAFIAVVMSGSYLYSKSVERGVSRHIGTGGPLRYLSPGV